MRTYFSNRSLDQELFVQAAASGDLHKLAVLIPQFLKTESHLKEIDSLIEVCYDALQSAAENGHAEVVKEVLPLVQNAKHINEELWKFKMDDESTGLNPQRWYFFGSRMTSSPLHLAVREGHLTVVEEFVSFFQRSSDVFPKWKAMYPYIWMWLEHLVEWFKGLVEWAVRWGHADILKLLLTHDPLMVPLDPADESAQICLPLYLAVQHNHLELLSLVQQIDSKSPIFKVPILGKSYVDGLTALHLAAHSGSKDMVEFLVNTTQIDVNARSDPELFTPLHVAAESGNLEVVQLLLRRSFESDDVNIEAASEWKVDILVRDAMGRTALHYAARQGHDGVVQDLLDVEIKLASIVDYDGLLALHMAARSGHARVIEKLCKSSYDVYNINQQAKQSVHIKGWIEQEYMRNEHTHPPIKYHGQIHRFLRPKLMDSLFFQTRGFTALHFAARYGQERALRQLLKESSINVLVKDDRGFLAYDWMEVQKKGELFLTICLEEEVAGNGLNNINHGLLESIKEESLLRSTRGTIYDAKVLYRRQNMALDIEIERKAMEDFRSAWGSGDRTPLGVAIVRWLEEEDIGRVRVGWLRWAVGAEDIGLVKCLLGVLGEFEATREDACSNRPHYDVAHEGEALAKAFSNYTEMLVQLAVGQRSEQFADQARLRDELKLQLKFTGNNRLLEAAQIALTHALLLKKYKTAREIIMQVPEVATFKHSARLVLPLLPYDDFGSDFVEALVTRSDGLPNASTLLTRLLAWARVCGQIRLVELILDRAEVKKGLYEDRKVYLDCANAMLVGAALIAGLAFQGWLQPPLGYNYEYGEEKYAEVQQWAVRWFWRSNNGAFFLAVGALIAGGKGAVPVADEMDLLESVDKARRAVAVGSALLGMALPCVMVAFVMAQVAVLPPRHSDRQMVVTSVTGGGGVLCSLLLIWFFCSVCPLLLPTLGYFRCRLLLCILHPVLRFMLHVLTSWNALCLPYYLYKSME